MQDNIVKIKYWDASDFMGLIAFLRDIWIDKDDVVTDWTSVDDKQVLEFSIHNTRNLPEQTQYINALIANASFKDAYYYKWVRGGNYYFMINATALGYVLVSDYIKQRKITRQAFWNTRHKHDVIFISSKKALVKVKKSENGK